MRLQRLGCSLCAGAPPSPLHLVPPAASSASPQVAFIGFCVQALATRTTPLEGLFAHLGNPTGRNITYYLTHLPETLAK